MKRAAIGVLVVSLLAVPTYARDLRNALTAPHCVTLEHVRGSWRMDVVCHQGQGTIVLDDSSSGAFHGQGIFAGWSQEQMRALYNSLIPGSETKLDLPQLG